MILCRHSYYVIASLLIGYLHIGKTWCGDCVVGEPIIDRVLSNADTDVLMLYMPLERTYYRSSECIFRSSKIQLKCVPTLIKWRKGKIAARLNDDQCQSEDIVREILDA